MADTTQLTLPLLEAAQAQKHVTMNEALMRLDALVPMVLVSRVLTVPPAVVVDGVAYSVPSGAVNGWAGQAGKIAIGVNGGWEFATPSAGWRAWILAEGRGAVHDGTTWQGGMATLSSNGAGTQIGVTEIEHVIGVGLTSTTQIVIPAHAMVIGVTARVTATLTGSLASWQLGSAGAPDRFGSGLGLAAGSWARGMLGSPFTYYAPTPLILTGVGGDFAGGEVRIAAHYLEVTLPAL